MMVVILLLAFDVLHWEGAGHLLPRRAIYGKSYGLIGLIDDVFGEGLTVNFYDPLRSQTSPR